MAETSASGLLNIEINGSNPSDPIEGAKVTITEHRSSRIVKILETDRQGQINAIELQTVHSSSEDPWRPYKKYDLSVEIPLLETVQKPATLILKSVFKFMLIV